MRCLTSSYGPGSTDAHGGHTLPGRIARKLRIGVEGDDVFHARQNVRSRRRQAQSGLFAEPRRNAFNSESFPRLRSYPIQKPFPLIPSARAMEKEKSVILGPTYFAFNFLDSRLDRTQ